ncbi:MAG TPA: AMP-binding protein, partial [Chloroflexota bacterium]|nr:AMP-binding protein [Chloroflexota bacterium]
MDVIGNRTLYDVLANRAGYEPGREWLIFERADGRVERWTCGEFLAGVHRAANLLASLGIGPGDAFNLHLGNHPAYPQLILAASYLGAVAVPTNPVSTLDELGYLVGHSESKLIFTQASCFSTASRVAREVGVRAVVVCETGEPLPKGAAVYEAELAPQSSVPPERQGSVDAVVELLYTSGTTARPKGVMLTNASFVYAAEVFRAASGLRPEDRHLIALPMFHAAAQCHALWPSLVGGASVALLGRFQASRYFEQAATHDATLAAMFGALLRMLLNQPERPFDRAHRLRNVTFAQNLSEAQYREWHRRFGAPLQQLWGMTETCGLPVMSPLLGDRRLDTMGRPVLGYELKVVDDAGNEALTGTAGQLLVRGIPGRTIMKGYFKNPEATAKTLRPDGESVWLASGDTVRGDAAGFLSFIDRGRDLIKRAGENI